MKLSHSLKRIFILLLGNTLIFGLLLALVEGLASFALLLRDGLDQARNPSPARQQYVQYDAELGWINKPNLDLLDVYGRGVFVRTNNEGFRTERPTEKQVAQGKTRIICSGDSYTFGYGVDNDHTWCAMLARFDPALDPVNMGNDGYGVDQAYLRYKRQAAAIEHQLHFFAFITDDFYRMLSDSFLGYPKPRLEFANGRLTITNLPVPVTDGHTSRFLQIAERVKGLRTFQFARRISAKLIGQPLGAPENTHTAQLSQNERDAKARVLFEAILTDLIQSSRRNGVQLALVYLPTLWELQGRPLPGWSSERDWSEFLKQEAHKRSVPLIDLFATFKALSEEEIVSKFIPEGKLPYPEARYHMNEQGNETVARAIYERLSREPSLACALAARRADDSHLLDANPAGQYCRTF